MSDYLLKHYNQLKGGTIRDISMIQDPNEMGDEDWVRLIIQLEDGTVLAVIPSSDPELNESGHLYIETILRAKEGS